MVRCFLFVFVFKKTGMECAAHDLFYSIMRICVIRSCVAAIFDFDFFQKTGIIECAPMFFFTI